MPADAGPRAVLRVRTFRWLLSVQLTNAVAVWVHVVGVQWLLTERGEPATVVALAPAAMAAPFLLLSMPVGVLASHSSRERLLVGATAVSASAAIAAAVLAATGADSPAPLLLTVVVVGSALVVVGIAWQSLLPELVDRPLVASAALLDGAVYNVARAVGPLTAGAVLGLAPPVVLFGVIAAMFAGCTAVLLAVGVTTGPPPRRTESVAAAMKGALWFVRHSPWTRGLLVRMVLFGVPAGALWALVSVVVHERLGLGATGFGTTMGLLGVGSVLGVLVLGRLRARISVAVFVALLAAGYAANLAALGLATGIGVLVPFLVLGGVGWVAVQSTWMMLAHQALPDWVRPRVVALLLLLFQGTQAAGALLWGAVADLVGVGNAMLAAAVLLVAYAGGLLVVGMRTSAGIEPVLAADELSAAVAELGREAGDGPIAIRYEYVVAAHRRGAFRDAMDSLRLSRLRLGARSWALAPPGPGAADATGTWTETYVVRDRSLFVEQETARLTVPERRLREAVRSTTVRVAGPVLDPVPQYNDAPAPRRRRGGSHE